jgi:hypothetical protein
MLRIKLFIIGLLGVTMLFTSCDPDSTGGGGTGGGGTNANAPSVSIFDDGTGTSLTFDSTVEPGQVFRIAVDALAIEAQLRAIEVSRDGFSLTADEFDNLNITDADEQNPQLLFGTDKDLFTWTYEFTAPEDEGSYFYDFIVSDDAGLESVASLTITVEGVLEVINPTITLMNSATIEAPAESLVQVNAEAVMGTFDLASVSVWEDGDLISDLTRIRFANIDFEANPRPLFDPNTTGFTEGIIIRTIAGTHDYIIRVTDTEGNNADVAFTISEASTGTALENQFDFVLFSNASGPSLGGLDLDNGVAVPSASADAEIRDLGIDTNQPAATNWIQRVEGVNGSDLRVVNLANLPDGFTFDGVSSKEEVAEAFNSGTAADPSPVLQVGDLLAVSSFTNIYIIQVDEVNVTDNDNEDFYRFSIKF